MATGNYTGLWKRKRATDTLPLVITAEFNVFPNWPIFAVDPETGKEVKRFKSEAKFKAWRERHGYNWILNPEVQHIANNPSPLMSALIGGAAGAMGGAVGGRAIDRLLDRVFPDDGEEMDDGGPDTIVIENPSDSAALAREFHGRDNRHSTEVIEQLRYESDLAELGYLVQLDIALPNKRDVLEITFDWDDKGKQVRLTSNAKGKQLYLLGGDQSLNLPDLKGVEGLDKAKVLIGPVERIIYFADKHHLSGPKQQKRGMQYYHDFAEEGGDLPMLVYDRLNEKMELAGGSYTIKDVGIVN